MCGFASTIVAGGTESMSLVPITGNKFSPNPTLTHQYPDVYLSNGLVADNYSRESGISRDEQDAYALRSHQRALEAIDGGRFAADRAFLCCGPGIDGSEPRTVSTPETRPVLREVIFSVDEGPRRDTSATALAKLRPAFQAHGTVTAGNSSQMSDGASAVVVMSATRARQRELTPLARFVVFATAGVRPEVSVSVPYRRLRKC